MGNFGGRDDHCKVYGFPAISYAKPAELIKTPIGMLSQVDARNHVLDRGTDPPCEGQIDGEGHAPTRPTTLYCELCRNR